MSRLCENEITYSAMYIIISLFVSQEIMHKLQGPTYLTKHLRSKRKRLRMCCARTHTHTYTDNAYFHEIKRACIVATGERTSIFDRRYSIHLVPPLASFRSVPFSLSPSPLSLPPSFHPLFFSVFRILRGVASF